MSFFDWLSAAERKKERRKRIFISFAIEDVEYRDFLVDQGKNERSPFDFTDMSVKKKWKQHEWRYKCRIKIKGCDGVIVLLSSNTLYASGVRWEINCALEEGVEIIGMYIKKNDRGIIMPELRKIKTITWSWNNLEKFINNL